MDLENEFNLAVKLENEKKYEEALIQYQKVADAVIAEFYSTHEEPTDELFENKWLKKCDEAYMRLGDEIEKIQRERVKNSPVGELKFNGFIFVSACCEKMKKTIASKKKHVGISYDCHCGSTHISVITEGELMTENYHKCPFCGAEPVFEEVE